VVPKITEARTATPLSDDFIRQAVCKCVGCSNFIIARYFTDSGMICVVCSTALLKIHSLAGERSSPFLSFLSATEACPVKSWWAK